MLKPLHGSVVASACIWVTSLRLGHLVASLVPRPHLRERVWWHLVDSSCFINVDYFLERNISPPITLQIRQSVRVWWHPVDSSGFINVDYFLERNISPPITMQRRQSVVQHRNSWLLQHNDTALFWRLNCAYSQLWSFNEAQGISWMSPDPLLVGRVWGRDYLVEGFQPLHSLGFALLLRNLGYK